MPFRIRVIEYLQCCWRSHDHGRYMSCVYLIAYCQKNSCTLKKIESALLPPQPPPPLSETRYFMGMGLSCRKNAFFQAPRKLAQPSPAPELRAKHFTDMRIFLILLQQECLHASIYSAEIEFQMHYIKICMKQLFLELFLAIYCMCVTEASGK